MKRLTAMLVCLTLSVTFLQAQVLKKEKLPEDTSNAGKEVTGGTAPCSKLSKVASIIISKTPESEFEISFVDAKDNPVSGFMIRQFNESLFYDKVKTSLLGLCNDAVPAKTDSAKVDNLVADFKKMSLYQHMLEAGLEVNDDDVYAGKLTIHKTVDVTMKQIHTVKRAETPKAPKKAQDSSSVFIANQYVFWTRYLLPAKSEYTYQYDQTDERDTSVLTITKSDTSVRVRRKTIDSIFSGPAVLTVYQIQIQFQDGFIENIKVRGKIPQSNKLLKFENAYPIAFSTRRDFRRLYEISLTERTIFQSKKKNNAGIDEMSIKVGDLMDFDQNLDIDSKDYSPVNQVWQSEIKDDETIVNLKKERTSKILELKVFSDLKGIDSESPNGLVQLELSKKLNFWSNRKSLFHNTLNHGWLNYLTPSFTLSKIENNNKRLPVKYLGSREPQNTLANTYAPTLQLYQYQAFSVGANLALWTADVPGLKSIFTLKAGIYFGRTLTADTIREKIDSLTFKAVKDNNILESGVNSYQFTPEICMQIFPDKRYGVTLAYKAINYRIMNRTLKQVTDSADYANYLTSIGGNRSKINDYPFRRWLASAEVFAFYRPSAYSQLFFRYRFNYDLSQVKVNFHQLQLGFSTYLTHTNKGKKEQERSNDDQ